MDSVRFPKLVSKLYEVVAELESMFPGRHFTPDGHMVGSIGEALAAHHYGVKLLRASSPGRDAVLDGKSVEIKATQGNRVALRSAPEHLLVLKLQKDGGFSEIYNGTGERVWAMVKAKKRPSNGQFQVSLGALRKLNKQVAPDESIKRAI